MKIRIDRANFYFYSFLFMFLAYAFNIYSTSSLSNTAELLGDQEQRVIKCQIPINEEMTQNLYYVAHDLKSAKKMLFNNKNGLFFDKSLYIKTIDFKGNKHVVPFDQITCDAIGAQFQLSNQEQS